MNAPEHVRVVLAEARDLGLPFDSGWYRALRSLQPPPDCPQSIVDEHAEDSTVLREMKAHFRAAYEGRLPTDRELEVGMDLARRRLRDLVVPDPDDG